MNQYSATITDHSARATKHFQVSGPEVYPFNFTSAFFMGCTSKTKHAIKSRYSEVSKSQIPTLVLPLPNFVSTLLRQSVPLEMFQMSKSQVSGVTRAQGSGCTVST